MKRNIGKHFGRYYPLTHFSIAATNLFQEMSFYFQLKFLEKKLKKLREEGIS